MEHDIVIDANGDIAFIYSDDLLPLTDLGEATTRRASHVEPHPFRSGWLADMTPIGGPIIGANDVIDPTVAGGHVYLALDGFALRQDALDAERNWLREHRGL